MSKRKPPIPKPCLTQDAVYSTKIESHRITVSVECPTHIDLTAPDDCERLHGKLETRAHDGMEWVLGPWFFHATCVRRVELAQKKGWPDFHLSLEETAELVALDAYVDSLAAFSETPSDNAAMKLIRDAAKMFSQDRSDLAAAQARITALEGIVATMDEALAKADTSLGYFAGERNFAKWTYRGTEQDPNGVHSALEAVQSACSAARAAREG